MSFVCSICTDKMIASSEIRATQCGHIFHHECLEKWLRRARNCPECRANCTMKSVIRLFATGETEPPCYGTQRSERRARNGCRHTHVERMACLEHRICVDDCRSPMVGIFLKDFHQTGENGCKYCVDCAQLVCTECKSDLHGTCVRYKRKVYHEECFPCLTCRSPLNGKYSILKRPSYRYHDGCLYCAWCYMDLNGELFGFCNELPVCQECNKRNQYERSSHG